MRKIYMLKALILSDRVHLDLLQGILIHISSQKSSLVDEHVVDENNITNLLIQIEQLLSDISAQLDTTTVESIIEILRQIGLAFVGALLAFMFALWLEKRQRVMASTEALINEFSSREMLKSRFVTVGIADRVANGELPLKFVASSSLQGAPKGFIGEEIDGLTEHQHMSHMIGYYRRLALALRHRWVNQDHIERTIGGSLHWTLPFLVELADETESLAKEYPTGRSLTERAAWISSIRYVTSKIDGHKLEMFSVPEIDYSLTHEKNIRPVPPVQEHQKKKKKKKKKKG